LLLHPEVVNSLVGFLVEEIVLIIAQPVPESAILPQLFEECLSFLWCVIKSVPFRECVEEASETI
jgi:hypothetical protein